MCYASGYLQKEMQNPRFSAPNIIAKEMSKGTLRIGPGEGMYKWEELDQERFKLENLRKFVELLNLNSALKKPVL